MTRKPKPFMVGTLTYEGREHAQNKQPLDECTPDCDQGVLVGWFTGEVDTWGKRTFIACTPAPSPLFLFADEIIEWEPKS